MTRQEMLARYRHLRAINRRQQSDALDLVPKSALFDCARRLRIARGRTLMLDNPDEMTLVFDLLVHAGVGGRTRAIDRYAARNKPAPGTAEALVLSMAQQARFAVWQVEQRHEMIGVWVSDFMSHERLWLIDESLEACCPKDLVLAGRLMAVDDFVMTCGVLVPIDEFVLEEAWRTMPKWDPASMADVIQDSRFATAIYRAAIHTGTMDQVRMVDPTPQNLARAALAAG